MVPQLLPSHWMGIVQGAASGNGKRGAGSTVGAQSTRLFVSFVRGDVGSKRMTSVGLSPDTCLRTLCGSGGFPLLFHAWPLAEARDRRLGLCDAVGHARRLGFPLGILRAVPLASVGDQGVEGTRDSA